METPKESLNRVLEFHKRIEPYKEVINTAIANAKRTRKMTKKILDDLMSLPQRTDHYSKMDLRFMKEIFDWLGVNVPLLEGSSALYSRFSNGRLPKFAIREICDLSPDIGMFNEIGRSVRMKMTWYDLNPTVESLRGSGQYKQSIVYDNFIVKFKYNWPQLEWEKEIRLWFNKPEEILCPILYIPQEGDMIFMPRTQPITNFVEMTNSLNEFDINTARVTLASGVKVERVREVSAWGLLEGRPVIVEYGYNNF